MSLTQIMKIVVDHYADRPALGMRPPTAAPDEHGGAPSVQLQPRYETITYRQMWDLSGAIADGLVVLAGVRAGDRVCQLGFASVDYVLMDIALMRIGATAVPLQAGGRVEQLASIFEETRAAAVAVSVEHLATAVAVVADQQTPVVLVVFDYVDGLDAHNDMLETARSLISQSDDAIRLVTVADLQECGPRPAVDVVVDDSTGHETTQDPALLIYTSGSTGSPKGAIYPEDLVAEMWRSRATWSVVPHAPSITLTFVPMSHFMARAVVYGTLGRGGIAYFASKSDLSTLMDDLVSVRPTRLILVPRIANMLADEYQRALARYSSEDGDVTQSADRARAEVRNRVLGGRVLASITGSAPMSTELRELAEGILDAPIVEGYGATETGMVIMAGWVQRPPVIDYKLIDVPELNYFTTDRPFPRGELILKSQTIFGGYFNRPDITAAVFDADGYYRTGDIMAECGPDQLMWLDRRNFVVKLSQGEFVAVSQVEAALGTSPLVEQIYVYGDSQRDHLLAVVVPTAAALGENDVSRLKPLILASLREAAAEAGLRTHEIPLDCLVESIPFTAENGLLTGIRKPARPQLQARYGSRLAQLYDRRATARSDELRRLMASAAHQPLIDTVMGAVGAVLGIALAELTPDTHFAELGGDSLSAVTLGNSLTEILGVQIPVSLIVSPMTDLQGIVTYVEQQRTPTLKRPTFSTVHGAGMTRIAARDLQLEKFFVPDTSNPVTSSPSLGSPTVLLTGATGYLGRFLALAWLERLHDIGGTLICLVRAKDEATAWARLDGLFGSGDPNLKRHFELLAAEHLRIVVGEKSQPRIGLDEDTWRELAETVDVIVDPAALVNHVLPYSDLFEPNVVGTAELIRLALTGRPKRFIYVSTMGVSSQIDPTVFDEDSDIRTLSPIRTIDDDYANGYTNSKWAGEVLLREANERFGLPVVVFRCGMLMADSAYVGQLNVPDMVTRLILSVLATGLAPESFYVQEPERDRKAHFDGLPVKFVAEAISALSELPRCGYQTYNVVNPHDDGINLDTYVDWLVDEGRAIQRIVSYETWLQRFELALRALPDEQRSASVLPLIHHYQRPEIPFLAPKSWSVRFRAAVDDYSWGVERGIPHISAPVISQYVTSLGLLGLI